MGVFDNHFTAVPAHKSTDYTPAFNCRIGVAIGNLYIGSSGGGGSEDTSYIGIPISLIFAVKIGVFDAEIFDNGAIAIGGETNSRE